MKHAQIGTVSCGTLKPSDLLGTFSDELEALIQDNADHWCGRQTKRDELCKLVWDARECDEESEDADNILDELFSALEYFAPRDAYFGALEGDGADFGFWPVVPDLE